MLDSKHMFRHWNNLTKTCYEHEMRCQDCPYDKTLCSMKEWNSNPYGIRNIKYAMLRTLSSIGEPKHGT